MTLWIFLSEIQYFDFTQDDLDCTKVPSTPKEGLGTQRNPTDQDFCMEEMRRLYESRKFRY